MGYTTEFSGSFKLDRTPSKEILNTIDRWSGCSEDQPIGGYCQWQLTGDDKNTLEWDRNEKFYNYKEWLAEIIKLLSTEGIVLNGQVFWSGEERADIGEITVVMNTIKIREGIYFRVRDIATQGVD